MQSLKVGNALEVTKKLKNESISHVITDPPYFIEGMGDDWDNENLKEEKNETTSEVVSSLPAGMKHDKSQGEDLYKWYFDFSETLIPKLKPGSFFLSFSSPRLYHRMASAVEDAGFIIRDCFYWVYLNKTQPKAMSLKHFLEDKNIPDREKQTIRENLKNWKTPQVKKNAEPIVVAQKPYQDTFLNNFIEYKTGLINTKNFLGNGKFPSNFIKTEKTLSEVDKHFYVNKPDKKDYNDHMTVKPVSLISYLISLFSYSPDDLIYDPFLGSGTTALACEKTNRDYLGVDINEDNIKISKRRIKEYCQSEENKSKFFD